MINNSMISLLRQSCSVSDPLTETAREIAARMDTAAPNAELKCFVEMFPMSVCLMAGKA